MRYLLPVLFLTLAAGASAAGVTYSPGEELIYRINFGRADDVKILLDEGANPNTVTEQGDPVLSVALERDDNESAGMVKALLDKGANPNTPDKAKDTPLMSAIKKGHGDMVALLMEKGADYHAKTADGMTLAEYARQNNKADAAKPIADALGLERATAASMRSPERFKSIIREYSYHSCSYQYWSYYLASRQDPANASQTAKKIAASKDKLSELLEQIHSYYPSTKAKDIQSISDDSAQTVYDALDVMISNRNRAEHGVGQDDDAKARCQKIADSVKVDFVPANLKQ